jgi:hypothetical protein
MKKPRILSQLVWQSITEGTPHHQSESKSIGASEKVQVPS